MTTNDLPNTEVYIDGAWHAAADARVPVFDRGFFYGDGVFETVAVYHGQPFRFAQHYARLERGLRTLGIESPCNQSQLLGILHESLARNRFMQATLRISITRGVGPRGLKTTQCKQPSLTVCCYERAAMPSFPPKLNLITATTRRTPSACIDPAIKTGNYLNAILAMREAEQLQADDALMLNMQNIVAECTAANVFFWRNGCLCTPALDCGIMPGIVRQAVLELAAQLHFPTQQGRYGIDDVYTADEVFITNSGVLIAQIGRLDQRHYPLPAQHTLALQKALCECISREIIGAGFSNR